MSRSRTYPELALRRIEASIEHYQDGACDVCGRRPPAQADRFCSPCRAWLSDLPEIVARDAAAPEPARAEDAAEQRLHSLQQAGRQLASSQSDASLLQQLVRVPLPSFADWSALYLVDESDCVSHVELACADPAKAPLLADLQCCEASQSLPQSIVANVLRTGEPELVSVADADRSPALAADERTLELLLRLGFRCALATPLWARARLLGVLVLVSADPDRRYGRNDLAFAELLASLSALAVDNARLAETASEATRQLSEYVSVAAHELKTPVTSLHGFVQLLERLFANDERYDLSRVQRAIEVVDRQADRLSFLVDQLLDVTHIEGGQLRLAPQPVELRSLCEMLAAEAQERTTSHTFTVRAASALHVQADAARLEQVIVNLLDNAIKFSPGGGAIEIDLSSAAGAARPSVTDHGIGVPAQQQRRLFSRFFQAHPGDQYGGMGLGLFISRHIVELHGGSLEFEAPPGGGSRFTIVLADASLPAGKGGG